MILSVDVMGFENPINDAIKACRKFVKKNNDVKIILVGDKQIISKHLITNDEFEIEDATDVITMDDNPLLVRNKKQSSMYKAIDLVKQNKADGVLSAGNTACYVVMCYLLLGKFEWMNKIAFMPFIPTINKKGLNLLDCGANKTVDAKDLVDFAYISSLYCKYVRKIENPRVGLINIGTEDNKGLDYIIEAHKLLKENNKINYVGYLEPRYMIEEKIDIAIADGFIGNIVLKTLEGTAKSISKVLLNEYKKPFGWLGFLFSIVPLVKLKSKFDYKNNAGAFVIGLKKIAFKTHGSADFKQFYSSLRMLRDTIKSSVIEEFEKGM